MITSSSLREKVKKEKTNFYKYFINGFIRNAFLTLMILVKTKIQQQKNRIHAHFAEWNVLFLFVQKKNVHAPQKKNNTGN